MWLAKGLVNNSERSRQILFAGSGLASNVVHIMFGIIEDWKVEYIMVLLTNQT